MKTIKKTSSDRERFAEIREYISGLEHVKEAIIGYLAARSDLERSTANLWSTDMKECYYSIVAAWQLLATGTPDKQQFLTGAGNFLQAAQSRFAQVSSELISCAGEDAHQLNRQLEECFTTCHRALSSEWERLSTGNAIKKATEKVLKVGEEEYHLLCSVCSEVAVKFKIGVGKYDKQESLVVSGITFSTSLDRGLAPQLFKFLEEKNLGRVHGFMKTHYKREGLDAYCPKCGKIYCARHYQTREEYDEGYYDCTRGTCPHGHKRIIHNKRFIPRYPYKTSA